MWNNNDSLLKLSSPRSFGLTQGPRYDFQSGNSLKYTETIRLEDAVENLLVYFHMNLVILK